MRFARGDMRDHIASHKTHHGVSYRRYGALQWRSRLKIKINLCGIFGIVRFSTFTTKSATIGLMRRTTGPGRSGDYRQACEYRLTEQRSSRRAHSRRLIRAWHRSNEMGMRLEEAPGVGPGLATALVAAVADPKSFRSGRNFSAWIGMVPKQHSSGARTGSAI
jgi:transposase